MLADEQELASWGKAFPAEHVQGRAAGRAGCGRELEAHALGGVRRREGRREGDT